LGHFFATGTCDLFQVFLKLFGFKYSIFIRQSALSATVLPANPV
jgi:hypothetical protein